MNQSDKRGAALILEIIIYLVIVALIAVAVTSGVRATRDLVFTSHAKGDAKVMQEWMESKYSLDGKYPGGSTDQGRWEFPDGPVMTSAHNIPNEAAITSVNGAGAGYCIVVNSSPISDRSKSRFWITSTNPSRIMQSGTASVTPPAGANMIPPNSGIPGLNCPW